jgi:hypothetical protein
MWYYRPVVVHPEYVAAVDKEAETCFDRYRVVPDEDSAVPRP